MNTKICHRLPLIVNILYINILSDYSKTDASWHYKLQGSYCRPRALLVKAKQSSKGIGILPKGLEGLYLNA